MNPADGITIVGAEASDGSGRSVASAGDVNSDGFDDLIIGSPFADGAGNLEGNAGESYVVFGAAFGTDGTPVNTVGDSSAEILIGGAGADTLVGGGGADVIRGGAGDDILSISDDTFAKLDGGGGQDTLQFDGAGITVDMTIISNTKIVDIEMIDITGSGDNTLMLGLDDVFDFSSTLNTAFSAAESHNSLVVEGDAGDSLLLLDFTDTVTGGAWQLDQSDVDLDGNATPGDGYDIFNFVDGTDTLASVAVFRDVTVDWDILI